MKIYKTYVVVKGVIDALTKDLCRIIAETEDDCPRHGSGQTDWIDKICGLKK
jgi:hypothetical protein